MKQLICVIFFFLSFYTSVPASDWNLVWQDNFDYNGPPDPELWGYDIGGGGWGNNELQYYTDRLENVRVEDGVLIIEARHEHYEKYEYTSARLVTRNKGDWLYGKVEVRAKLPGGRGMWPAIWMLPTDWEYGEWPGSGEIDIMEYVGFDPNKIHWTVHTEAYNHMNNTERGSSDIFDDPENNFYTYAIEWFEDRIHFFVDDELHFTFGKEDNATYSEWPFDKRFHLLLNIAVGGNWGGLEGVDDGIFPQRMEIDYVRVYEMRTPPPYTINIESSVGGKITVYPLKDEYTEGESVEIMAVADSGYSFQKISGSIYSSQDSIRVRVNRDLNLSALFLKEGEMIINGDFSQQLHYWSELITHNGAIATGSAENEILEIDITDGGESPWDVQVNQAGLNLLQGQRYVLSFDASSPTSNTMTAGVAINRDPWFPYFSQSVQLTAQMSSYQFEFTMDDPNDPAARLFFDVGGSEGIIIVDNVSLVRKTTTVSTAPKTITTDSPVSSFNLKRSTNSLSDISLSIPQNSSVTLSLLSLNGRTVESIHGGRLKKGKYHFTFNVPNGIYLIKLTLDGQQFIRPMVLY
ncbi:family 16 glycosylhydrolase [Chitinispirillales bacterium ANBcel5]|uniref:family 16 glycosylhydrolase n=1 Tax=Cellulosispirillum alkaliphilum TaxID=3039283 RepID=UPI002A4E350F|nr:family 16 glycosylhydrolase [Chitinispirillales bacterium ANBcel5]